MDAKPVVCRVQHPAPEWEAECYMPDKTFKKVKLSDFKGKYVVMMWYPLDFTFVCPTEIIQFSDKRKEFDEWNCVTRIVHARQLSNIPDDQVAFQRQIDQAQGFRHL